MSADRDELRELVDELPEEQVSVALADLRRHLTPHRPRQWPPAWFGSITSGRTDAGRNHDDLLADGFGRSQ